MYDYLKHEVYNPIKRWILGFKRWLSYRDIIMNQIAPWCSMGAIILMQKHIKEVRDEVNRNLRHVKSELDVKEMDITLELMRRILDEDGQHTETDKIQNLIYGEDYPRLLRNDILYSTVCYADGGSRMTARKTPLALEIHKVYNRAAVRDRENQEFYWKMLWEQLHNKMRRWWD